MTYDEARASIRNGDLIAISSPGVLARAVRAFTGETLTEIADKILANPPTYYAAVGSIAGLRRVTMAAVDALTNADTFEADVKAITDAAEVQAQARLAQILGG